MIGFAVFVRRHSYHLIAFHFSLEGTTNTAVGAGRYDAVVRQTLINDALFHQRRGRTGLHTGAAGNAFGVEKTLINSGRNLGLETTALNR